MKIVIYWKCSWIKMNKSNKMTRLRRRWKVRNGLISITKIGESILGIEIIWRRAKRCINKFLIIREKTSTNMILQILKIFVNGVKNKKSLLIFSEIEIHQWTMSYKIPIHFCQTSITRASIMTTIQIKYWIRLTLMIVNKEHNISMIQKMI